MPASKAQSAKAAEKRKKAVALRLAGMDWQAVADQSGYASAGAACTAVTEALKVHLQEQKEVVEELRAVEIARYDRLQAAFWPKAITEKDPKAAEVVLKCIAGRVKLTGTEAPLRTEHSGPGGAPIAFTSAEMDEFEALLTAGDVPAPDPDSESTGDDGD
jgi:type III secretion system FlhB-like substrate exporter